MMLETATLFNQSTALFVALDGNQLFFFYRLCETDYIRKLFIPKTRWVIGEILQTAMSYMSPGLVRDAVVKLPALARAGVEKSYRKVLAPTILALAD